MKFSVSQADIDLLTRLYRFCDGYDIPEGPDAPTLAQVLGALEEMRNAAVFQCAAHANPKARHDADERFVAALSATRAIISQFKPVAEPVQETSDA